MGVSPQVCDLDEVVAIDPNPRFARLREFNFRIEDLQANLRFGRCAENAARHKFNNYDAMLKAGGGLLYPEQYEQVRKGVDLVAGAMGKAMEAHVMDDDSPRWTPGDLESD